MQIKFSLGIFFLWAAFAQIADASVRITEVAWMGTVISGTNEWIELSNDQTTSVDISGWRIEAEDGSPSIPLSGTILGNGYFLIERTGDDTVPEISADLVAAFGNGLSNSGETLRLKDGSGVLIDTVVGGNDWSNIGGDNTTKQTAQRTANSWITGEPTPRAANVSSGEVAGVSTDTGSATTPSSSVNATTTVGAISKSTYSSAMYPRKEMRVSVGEDRHAFVGLPVSFSGTATGLYDETLPYATYRWNFGDGATGEGKEVSHTYRFPGEYVVTLEVFYGNLRNTARLSVVASKADVVISQFVAGETGFLEITNRTQNEIDISGWMLKEDKEVLSSAFTFPAHTTVLASKSVIFPNVNVGITEAKGLVLTHPDGVVASESPQVLASAATRAPGIVKGATTYVSAPQAGSDSSPLSKSAQMPASLAVNKTSAKSEIANSSGEGDVAAATVLWSHEKSREGSVGSEYDISSTMKWFFVFAILALLIFAGMIIAKSRVAEPSAADEYAIIEDIIEAEEDKVS